MTNEEEPADEDLSHAEHESAFAWEWRMMAVALFCSLPGVLFGLLLRLVIPDGGPPGWWVLGGGMLGVTMGGLLEADHLP